jgi:hypothetical protein
MYLTDKMRGIERDRSDHQVAELLLEYCASDASYVAYVPAHPFAIADERRLDETSESCERLSTLLSEVDSNISLVLQSTRVRLQNLELQVRLRARVSKAALLTLAARRLQSVPSLSVPARPCPPSSVRREVFRATRVRP